MKMFTGQIEWKESYKIINSEEYFKVFDKNGNQIYYENSNKFWVKREFDENDNQIYWKNSNGKIINNRPKLNSIDEITKRLESQMIQEYKTIENNYPYISLIEFINKKYDEIIKKMNEVGNC